LFLGNRQLASYLTCKFEPEALADFFRPGSAIAYYNQAVPDELRMTPDSDTMLVGFTDGTMEK